MRLTELIQKMAQEESVNINGGEVTIFKNLKEIIGGVPIYNIVVSFNKEEYEQISFESTEDFIQYCIDPHNDGGTIPFCLYSGQFPEDGYILYNETNDMFINTAEFEKYLDEVFDSWKVEIDNFDGMTYYKEVMNIEFETGHKEEVFEEDDRMWRKLDVTFVGKYDFIEDISFLKEE